jgi:hypothetical protein
MSRSRVSIGDSARVGQLHDPVQPPRSPRAGPARPQVQELDGREAVAHASPGEGVHRHHGLDGPEPAAQIPGGPQRGGEPASADLDRVLGFEPAADHPQARVGTLIPGDDDLGRGVPRPAVRAEQQRRGIAGERAAPVADHEVRRRRARRQIQLPAGPDVDVREDPHEPRTGQLVPGHHPGAHGQRPTKDTVEHRRSVPDRREFRGRFTERDVTLVPFVIEPA